MDIITLKISHGSWFPEELENVFSLLIKIFFQFYETPAKDIFTLIYKHKLIENPLFKNG